MPNPENREATHVNLPKAFKEPPVNEYREALGTEEFRQVRRWQLDTCIALTVRPRSQK